MPPLTILPNTYVLLRLPNQTTKLIKVVPDSSINLGKFGSFPTNSLIHRPYHLTFDILDSPPSISVVSTEEITRDILGEELARAADEEGAENGDEEDGEVGERGDSAMPGDDAGLDDVRNNRETVDDPNAQKLSWKEIEELKKRGGGQSGREIINALMTSHTAIHQKTAYSLSKYALRKRSKYMKRFTASPVDVSALLDHLMNEKEPGKVMEMQQEGLGLMLAQGNVRFCPDIQVGDELRRGGRWLVIDEAGGLLVAAIAERLGLLEYEPKYLNDDQEEVGSGTEDAEGYEAEGPLATNTKAALEVDVPPLKKAKFSHDSQPVAASTRPRHALQNLTHPLPATANTITVVHANEQPNLSLLKYFGYDPNTPPTSHPLYTHLRTISYLSLLSPSSDPTLTPPERVPEAIFKSWKSGKKSAYLRKWRRWERSARTVMETRGGEFDGLLVASWMDVKSLLGYLVPFVRGSGQVVVWRPEREGLVGVVDACGKEKKGEWLRRKERGELPEAGPGAVNWEEVLTRLQETTGALQYLVLEDEEANKDVVDITSLLTPHLLPDLVIPSPPNPDAKPNAATPPSVKELDPTILLAPTIHSTTVRKYQVLPGRTHPVMTSRGGAEGYVFVATRVVPVEGKVEAMGKGGGRRQLRAKREAEQKTEGQS
ncbi:Gcd10p family-domain-containing protein [Terfezia claveryi]|nr:Gcd10p family-domain-containing protein [Terfezia claveryi]